MGPTNKLVSDLVAMEACYINTGHPDFLNGHRAMAIVNESRNGSKPVQVDPKTGKPVPLALQPQQTSQSLDTSAENSGFFGSFFASKNKKRMAAMEAPPPILKASGTLSERESVETEVIKLLINSYFNIVKRTMIDMVPKGIMLNLVQYVESADLFANLVGPAKRRCKRSCWKISTRVTSLTNCSRKATIPYNAARSVRVWSLLCYKPAKSSKM